MRIFLSYNTPDGLRAETLKNAIETKVSGAQVFFAPTTLRAGRFWMPQLGEAIAQADAFLLLVGDNLGRYQTIEYYQAFERHVMEPSFPLVPVLIAAKAPSLPFATQIQWITSGAPQAEPDLGRIISALKGEALDGSNALWRSINPYRGLASLCEEDAAFFFGREAEVTQVLAGLMDTENAVITLVGNSGVGKSSLVEAGVFAALKRREWPGGEPWPHTLKESRQWALLTVRAGEDPIRALIAAFAELWFTDATDPERVERRSQWEALLRAGKCTVSDLIDVTDERFSRELQLAPPSRIVLNINQSEELYTLTPDRERVAFSQLIAEGLADHRLGVLASLRSEYYGALQANLPLMKVSRKIDVLPLGEKGLKTVITGPARALGARFETEELADFIIKGAGGDKGALPLLADYMTDLWARMQKRGDGVLRLADQVDLVDAGRALSARADIFLEQHRRDHEAIRRLFTLRLALVPEEGEPVRRQVLRDRLSQEEVRLVDALASGDWRLVFSGNRGGDPSAPLIAEIAHEVLLERWETLRKWVADERQFLVLKGRVEKARARWEATGSEPQLRDAEALFQGLDLIQSEQYLATRGADFDGDDAAFIQASINARDAEREAQTRFRRRVQGGTAIAAVLLAIVAGFATLQWRDANREKIRTREALEAVGTTLQTLTMDVARKYAATSDASPEILETLLTTARQLYERMFKILAPSDDYLFEHALKGAVIHVDLVPILLKAKKYKEAERAAIEALNISNAFYNLSREIPDLAKAPELHWIRALSLDRVADVLVATNRSADAVAYYQESIEALRKVEHVEKYKRYLAISYFRLGNLYLDRGNEQLALAPFENGFEKCESVLNIATSDVNCVRVMRAVYSELASLKAKVGDRKSVGTWLKESLVKIKKHSHPTDKAPVDEEKIGWAAEIDLNMLELHRLLMRYTDEREENLIGAQNILKNIDELAGQAFATRAYARAADIRKELSATVEGFGDGPATAQALGQYSFYALFAREFPSALAAAERALTLAPGKLWIATNKAHALMFVGRTEEARALYLEHKGKTISESGKNWEDEVLNDFDQFEKAGLPQAQIAEFRALMVSKP
jgi:tetratricopeptide (TPR) repeat protein